MKNLMFGVSTSLLLVAIFFMILTAVQVMPHRYIPVNSNGKLTNSGHLVKTHQEEGANKKDTEVGLEEYPSGSSLPDCSHACGPCMPCKRVMVSFQCSIAESCPMVYRCICRGKYYHVPSN